MRNARNFAQLTQALAAAEHSRCSLEDHISRVEALAHSHDQMISLLAQGADLALFLRRMAALVGGSIHSVDDTLTIRDEVVPPECDHGLVAQLRQGRLDRLRILSAITASRADGRAALVHQDHDEWCFALTLHSDSRRGDSLLVSLRDPVDDIRMRNLERSAVALSIAKLWTERQIASSTLLRHLALVAQPNTPTIAAARDRLKLGPGQPVQLALIALPGTDRAARIDTIRHAGSRLDIVVDAIDDHCLAVGATSAVEGFVATLGRAQPGWAPGGQLSDPFTGLEETGNRYKYVAKIMQVMAKLTRLDRFLPESEVSPFARIFGSADLTGIGAFVTDRLMPLDKRSPSPRPDQGHAACVFQQSAQHRAHGGRNGNPREHGTAAPGQRRRRHRGLARPHRRDGTACRPEVRRAASALAAGLAAPCPIGVCRRYSLSLRIPWLAPSGRAIAPEPHDQRNVCLYEQPRYGERRGPRIIRTGPDS